MTYYLSITQLEKSMRYLLVIGGGFLIFGLFWFAVGFNAEGNYGGDLLMWIGGPVAIMGLILVLIYLHYRVPKKPLTASNCQGMLCSHVIWFGKAHLFFF